MARERIYLFDTTLRDGQQTPGVDFSLEDKLVVMGLLDELNREGRTIVLVTHDEQVAAHAKREIFLKDGKVDSDRALPGTSRT